MPALTPEFLFDFESNMQTITENQYDALSANLWWPNLMKTRPTSSLRELIAWLISTAQIEDLGKNGGNLPFEDIVSQYTTFEVREAGAGLKLLRRQIEDNDGMGPELAAQWSSDMGNYMAYWPQKRLMEAIRVGEATTSLSYDGVPFFSKAHPLNPARPGGSTFANLFSGAAASTPSTDPADAIYPGAAPIDDSVPVDAALVNLQKVFVYIRSIRMPNGVDPRFLRPVGLAGGPLIQPRIMQLTNAKFIAQAATGGGAASADVESLIQSMGLVKPTFGDELGSVDDGKSYLVVVEQLAQAQLGGFVYLDRESFKIKYYSGESGAGVLGIDAFLDRARELEWHLHGRNVVGYGHPYLVFKVKSS